VLERIPSDYRTPAVARAITAPSAILAAGVGASVVILAGAPLVAAAVVGAACWAGRVTVPSGMAMVPFRTVAFDASGRPPGASQLGDYISIVLTVNERAEAVRCSI